MSNNIDQLGCVDPNCIFEWDLYNMGKDYDSKDEKYFMNICRRDTVKHCQQSGCHTFIVGPTVSNRCVSCNVYHCVTCTESGTFCEKEYNEYICNNCL